MRQLWVRPRKKNDDSFDPFFLLCYNQDKTGEKNTSGETTSPERCYYYSINSIIHYNTYGIQYCLLYRKYTPGFGDISFPSDNNT